MMFYTMIFTYDEIFRFFQAYYVFDMDFLHYFFKFLLLLKFLPNTQDFFMNYKRHLISTLKKVHTNLVAKWTIQIKGL